MIERMHIDVYDSGDKGQIHKEPLVFVHGSCMGKWCWQKHFIPFFELHDYRCISIDLRGHGRSDGIDRLNHFKIKDYVEDVKGVIDKLDERAIVIGHAMGCGVLERLIEQEHVSAAIYIAPLPVQGEKETQQRVMKDYPWITFKSLLTRNFYLLVEEPKRAKKMLLSWDIPDDEFSIIHKNLQNESISVAKEVRREIVAGDLNKFEVPMMIVGGEKDWFYRPTQIRKTGERYGVEPIFFDGGNFLMEERCWEDVAKAIDNWIVSIGL